ncbi:MAG TPA: class I SAM-dependent methyltransferase [Xanthobacteraceae bacterium]
MTVTYQWVDCDRAVVAARYDRIAGLIDLIDWLLLVPPDLRARAARRLGLNLGDRVLEIGCGTGRNFPYLCEAVGPGGRIYGVDLSSGMLARAQQMCRRRGWANVELKQEDAAFYTAPERLDAVLFGFSYNTMPHHRLVLRQALRQLRPGGRIVIIDGKLPEGFGGRLLLRFSLWLMRLTVLGNPLIKPWEHLAAALDDFAMESFLFGCWYVCWGTKSGRGAVDMPEQSEERLIAAE